MPIEVACQCGKRFAARDDLAGKTVACPACKQPLKIAPPRVNRPAAVPVAQPEPTGVGSILDEIGLQTDGRGIVCPKCRQYIAIGSTVCKNCHYNLQTASVQTQAERAPRHAGGGYDWKALRDRAPMIGSVVDEELTFSDIVLCGFFGGCMFIYGLILFFRGHAKGILIMLGSLIVPAFLILLYIIFKVVTATPVKQVRPPGAMRVAPPAIERLVDLA